VPFTAALLEEALRQADPGCPGALPPLGLMAGRAAMPAGESNWTYAIITRDDQEGELSA
jgi:hypothetical protein